MDLFNFPVKLNSVKCARFLSRGHSRFSINIKNAKNQNFALVPSYLQEFKPSKQILKVRGDQGKISNFFIFWIYIKSCMPPGQESGTFYRIPFHWKIKKIHRKYNRRL